MHKRDAKFGIVAAMISTALLWGAVVAEPLPAFQSDENSAVEKASQQLLVIRSKGKYGLIDRSGRLALPPKYDFPCGYDSSYRLPSGEYFLSRWTDELLPVRIDGKCGYIDKNGTQVIPPQFSMAGPFHDGRAQVQVGEVWGMIDRTGRIIIEPRYSFVGPFQSGLARVALGGIRIEGGLPRAKWGFINMSGDEIVPPKYDYARSFVNGKALVNLRGQWRGMAGLSFQGGLWGVIDESGTFVVEPKIEIDSEMSLTETEPEANDDLLPVKYDGRYGYRDSQWNFVIEPTFEEAGPFSEQLARVKHGGKYGYIDKSGEWAITPRYLLAAEFSEGSAPVVTSGGVRYIDKQGNAILTVDCDEARPFKAGLAEVRVGGLWGIIDKRGRYLHKPQFTKIGRSDSDFIYIRTGDELRGLMNREGEIIVEPKYGFIGAFQRNGFAMIDTESMGLPPEFWVIDRKGNLVPGPMLPLEADSRDKKINFFPKRHDGKWGIVDSAGEFQIAPRFTGVKMLGVGILGLHQNQKWGMVDLENGQLIIEPTYYSISRFSEGLAETRPNPPPRYPPGNGDWVGYIDLKGQLVIPNKFARGSEFKGGIAQVSVLYKGDLDHYYIDKEGTFLWHPDQRRVP
jgi:hypothetical protein